MAEPSNLVLGLYDNPDSLIQAIRTLQAKKLGHLEAYTPYPIHGIDDALGLRRSPLGAMVMVMGILGALTAFGAQYWISAIDYPIVTGGKAPWSWEAFVPIMFEVTVLFATFTAGLGMLFFMNRLPFSVTQSLHRSRSRRSLGTNSRSPSNAIPRARVTLT